MARGKRGRASESADTSDVAAADTLAAEQAASADTLAAENDASADTLAADEQHHTPTTAGDRPDHPETPALGPGARVGRYIVVGALGRGGMGMVYKAFDPELDRPLALKVVSIRGARDDVSSAGERTRLAREAQAMAKVSHPNVISVHDVGVERRQVFVAMEYVDGVTLREWIRRRRRNWRDVVSMYVQAGRGLAAAHAAGLVHRDFKPENVLVGRDGRARVLDFGLARAASEAVQVPTPHPLGELTPDPDHTGPLSTPLTRAGAIMGTPGYMAPEQYTGGPADDKSDQFAFCVALYEALYRERPHRGRSLSDLKKQVLGGEIAGEPRGARVPRRVREILLRGLRVEPRERHRSMDALLDRLERTMTRATRVRAAIVAAVGTAGIAGAVMMAAAGDDDQTMAVCQGGERKLAGVWDEPLRADVLDNLSAIEGPRAETIQQRVVGDLNDYTDSWLAKHRSVCEATRVHGEQSEQALDLRMHCLDRQLSEVRELTRVLAEGDEKVVDRAAVVSGHLPNLSECDDVRALGAVTPRPDDEPTRKKLADLESRLDRAKVLSDAGKLDAAREIVEKALPEAKELGYEPVIARAYFARGTVERMSRAGEASREALRNALVHAERGGDDPLRARAAIDLIFVRGHLENQAQTGLFYSRIAEAMLDRLGQRPGLRSFLLSNKGTIYLVQQDHEAAVEAFEKAIELREQVYGTDSYDLISALNNLGSALNEVGRNKKAIEHLEHAVTIIEEIFGPDHPHRAAVLINLGLARYDVGRVEASLDAYAEAIDVYEKVFGPEHATLAPALSNKGDVLADLGRFDEAADAYRRSIQIRESAYGADSTMTGIALVGYGVMLRQKEDLKGSAEKLRHAVQIYENAQGTDHPNVARAVEQLARTRHAQGRNADALRLFERAQAIYEEQLGTDHGSLVPLLTTMAEIDLQLDQPEEGAAKLDRALEIAEEAGRPPQDSANARFALARALWRSARDRERAVQLAEEAHAAYESMGTPASEQRRNVESWLEEREN